MDTIFLLSVPFIAEDGSSQYCPDSMLIEGVLARFPELRERVDVRYVGFQKPREALVKLAGEARQSCPALIRRGDGEPDLIDDVDRILAILAREYGIPDARGKLI